MKSRSRKSFKHAAMEVLKAEKDPLSAKEITERALLRGLLSTQGATPEATMAAQLYVDIKENKKSKFRKVGKGQFSLREQTESVETPHFLIEQHNEAIEKALMQKLYEMDPFLFEGLVADLLQKIGYESVKVTKRSGDKGIDVIADLTMDGITSVKTVIQAKRYKKGNNISGAVITQLRGSAEVDQRGLVITTSDFTKDAKSESIAPNKMPVALVNGSKLLSLLIKYGVGTKSEKVTLYSLNSEYFESDGGVSNQDLDAGKNRSIWPLPGGNGNYVETLFLFLAAVENDTIDVAGMTDWYMKTFENVNSEKVARSYVYVPRKMGLIKFQNDQVTLTSEGRKVFETKDIELLFSTISQNILAFDDIVEFLKTTKTPQSEKEILEFLKDSFDIEWSTYAQVNFRLRWLESLEKIEKNTHGYSIKA